MIYSAAIDGLKYCRKINIHTECTVQTIESFCLKNSYHYRHCRHLGSFKLKKNWSAGDLTLNQGGRSKLQYVCLSYWWHRKFASNVCSHADSWKWSAPAWPVKPSYWGHEGRVSLNHKSTCTHSECLLWLMHGNAVHADLDGVPCRSISWTVAEVQLYGLNCVDGRS